MSDHRTDPGWGEAIVLGVLPFIRPSRGESEADGGAVLLALRAVFVSLIVAPGVIGFIAFILLRDVEPTPFGSAVVWALGALGSGLVGLIVVLRVGARPTPGTDPGEIVGGYRSFFMIGIALGELPALAAFAGALLTRQLWVYLVGFVGTLVILARVAPTSGCLDRWDRRLAQAGSRYSLREALTQLSREPGVAEPPEAKRISWGRRLGKAVMAFLGVIILVNFALGLIAELLRPIGLAPPPGAYAYVGPVVASLALAVGWRVFRTK